MSTAHRPRALRPSTFTALAAALAGCTLAGCAGSASQPTASSQADDGSTTATSSSAPAVPDSSSSGTFAARGPLAAERTTTDRDGNVIAFAPVSLRRSGDLVVLDVGVRNVTPSGKGKDQANLAYSFMSDGSVQFDGVFLVDGVNRKRHLVVHDVKGGCLCTSFFGGLEVGRGGSAELTAYFAAPPSGVTTMDVTLRKQGSFVAVPLS